MGNTSSSPDDYDREDFIKEQKKIIEEQNEQIKKLSNMVDGNILNEQNGHPLNGHNGPPLNEHNETFTKKKNMDPYKELNIGMNYDENSLKKAYFKRALITHPDRGGNEKDFQNATLSYRALMRKLQSEKNNNDHNQLRENSTSFFEGQEEDTFSYDKNLLNDFNVQNFNKMYDENRIEDIYDNGYEEWSKNDVDVQETYNGKLSEENFNHEFMKYKKKNLKKKGKEIQKYTEPMEDISYKDKSSLTILGQGKIKDFSGESGGLQYRDYKDAYTNTYLISDENINIQEKDIKQINSERENISYHMDEKQQQIYMLKKIKEEQEEELRIERLKQNDDIAFNVYDKIHQRMLNH